MTGFRTIVWETLAEIARRPVCWIGYLLLPMMLSFMYSNLMEQGLPTRIPAAIVDLDHTSTSRTLTNTLNAMQMVHITKATESFSEARHDMQRGEVYGYFLIPQNFERDLLAGRKPVISFYTNMTYFVPASLLFKTFKTTAVYSKAGVAVNVLQMAGANASDAGALMNPVNVTERAIGNPWLDYSIYLCNSFIPCLLQLMIFLVTCYSLGQEIKYGTSRQLLSMADGSIIKALAAKLLPQTIIWIVIAIFMESWLFKWNHFPMHGSWFWLTLSEIMFVLGSQGLAVFFFGLLPNLRLSLSISALLGILSFSLAAFSFPMESMYPAIGIFSWILPIRYNFLIYIDQALNGIPVYYSRIWFVAYIVFMLVPFTMLWNIKRNMQKPAYVR